MTWFFAPLVPGRYGVILADFPWRWKPWGADGDGRSPPYATMTIDKLATLPVAELADPAGAHLCAWITDDHLAVGIKLIEGWGFTYKSKLLVWDKRRICKGYDTRKETESCYRFTIGSKPPRRLHKGVRQLICEAPVSSEHSHKPDEQYRRIERLYGADIFRCELFSRTSWPDWEVWGDEVDTIPRAA